MTVKELYKILNEKIPPSLSCDWDNDGLMCCPEGERQIKKALVTLDVTEGAISYACEHGFDVIISHHPFIFKGLKAINEDNHIAVGAVELIKNNISVMSFHTRLDAAEGGVNDTLAALLELQNIQPFGENGETVGRIGEISENLTLTELAERVKTVTGAPFVLVADGKRQVKRVALLGGEGGDDIGAALLAGADTYISGRLGYHHMTDASGIGINLIEAGHFYTEFPVCLTLERMLAKIDSDIKTEIYYSNRIICI